MPAIEMTVSDTTKSEIEKHLRAAADEVRKLNEENPGKTIELSNSPQQWGICYKT